MASDNLGELSERLRMLARTPVLLVASDYDGVVAPLVVDPMSAFPNRSTVAALRSLAELSSTHVTVVSGRSLRDLALLCRLPEEIRLVGSHGSEFDLGFAAALDSTLVTRRDELVAEVKKLGNKYDALVEEKPASVTFHFRGMDPEKQTLARDEIVRGPAGRDHIFTRTGHDILELAVIDTNKGTALDQIRRQVGAQAVLFIGDDVTDEDGFRTLRGPDVGIKVGSGPTAAQHRIADTDTVAHILALLSELRTEWLRGEGLTPIKHYSMLSDLRTAAIVSPSARIEWLCVPRVDSAAVFAQLLGGSADGYFSIADAGKAEPIGQSYRENSLVLETNYPTFTVTDYFDCSSGRTRRLAGRSDLVRVIEGSGTTVIEFAPRLDFGRVRTKLEARTDGVVVHGTSDLMVLRSPGVEWEIVDDGQHQTARATVDIGDDGIVLELRSGTGTVRPDARPEPDRRHDTDHFWTNWLGRLDLPTEKTSTVARSALTIKALSHRPTGAIVSSATTSLPEYLGGIRNWDQRYCWLREGAWAATALARLGSYAEGMSYLDWLLRVMEGRSEPERLAPVYNVTGHHLPPEADITDLAGYAGSRPVRIGNAADGQVQLDTLLQKGEPLSSEHWHLVENMVLAVSRRWTEPDHGIWEIRIPPRQHVHSKVMCWVTVDRAIAIADHFLDKPPDKWLTLRDDIATDVLERGWKPGLGSFSATYDCNELDASVLAVGLSGLLPPEDKRFQSTVDTIEHRLQQGSTVYRYTSDDGLPGREGGLNIMTSWLIDALVLVGRTEDAKALFSDLCNTVGSTGLLSTQHDPATDIALGNTPRVQAHVGLINNALNLSAGS